jgi:short-subunit dehydrogenase
VDTLVNSVGVNFYGPALDISWRRYTLMFQMMVHAPLRLCQLAVPGMIERGGGWVLNVTSKQARHPKGPPYPEWAGDGCVPYGMCKAALDRLTTGLAAELYGSGCLTPGRTPRSCSRSTGVEHMWVNGVASRADGADVPGVKAGQLLRG